MNNDTIELTVFTHEDMIRLRFETHPIDVEHVSLYTERHGRAMCMTYWGHAGSPMTRDVTPR